MKKIISIILAVLMVISVLPVAFAAEGETVILYTNDVHCAIDDYAVLAAYKAQLEAQGNTVILVDVGDAIQGEVIGTLTEGEAVVDIMNAAGYDYAVPGNHEYDYGMETFLDIAENKAEYEYISSNFYYLPGVRGVFEPYAIEDIGDYQIAFVGITTPETVSKANPDYFKDENKNFIYGFPTWDMKEGVLFENVQESIDDAIAEARMSLLRSVISEFLKQQTAGSQPMLSQTPTALIISLMPIHTKQSRAPSIKTRTMKA